MFNAGRFRKCPFGVLLHRHCPLPEWLLCQNSGPQKARQPTQANRLNSLKVKTSKSVKLTAHAGPAVGQDQIAVNHVKGSLVNVCAEAAAEMKASEGQDPESKKRKRLDGKEVIQPYLSDGTAKDHCEGCCAIQCHPNLKYL